MTEIPANIASAETTITERYDQDGKLTEKITYTKTEFWAPEQAKQPVTLVRNVLPDPKWSLGVE